MTSEQNAQIVRESIEAALQQDWERLKNLYADDAILYGTPQPLHGNEAIVRLWQGCHDEEPQIEGEIISLIASDDKVAVEWRHRGIVGRELGLPENLVGRRIEGTEVYICHLRDGKITSTRIYGGECRVEGARSERRWVDE